MTLLCSLQLFHVRLTVTFTSDSLPFQSSAVGYSHTLDSSEYTVAAWLVDVPRGNVVPEPNCECPELKPHSACLKLSFPPHPQDTHHHFIPLWGEGVITGLNVGTSMPHVLLLNKGPTAPPLRVGAGVSSGFSVILTSPTASSPPSPVSPGGLPLDLPLFEN